MTAERASHRLGFELDQQRCVVQGFGNVGGVAASELHDKGATVIAISDISGGLYAPEGLDIPDLDAHVVDHGSLAGYHRCDRMANEEVLERPCGILFVPSRGGPLTAGDT